MRLFIDIQTRDGKRYSHATNGCVLFVKPGLKYKKKMVFFSHYLFMSL